MLVFNGAFVRKDWRKDWLARTLFRVNIPSTTTFESCEKRRLTCRGLTGGGGRMEGPRTAAAVVWG